MDLTVVPREPLNVSLLPLRCQAVGAGGGVVNNMFAGPQVGEGRSRVIRCDQTTRAWTIAFGTDTTSSKSVSRRAILKSYGSNPARQRNILVPNAGKYAR